jgi:hypothetical protein
MFESEIPYRIVAQPGKNVINFTPSVDTFCIMRWQCPPARPAPSKLQDFWVDVPATLCVAARCDLYTDNNWNAMIADIYGGSEAAYVTAHNAVEVNGNIIDERDGK